MPFSPEATHLLFQMMSWRYETKSTIITTNRPIAEWGLVLGDPMAATAIIDRLMQHCTAIAINGDSYRLKEHKLKNCLTDNLQAAKELKPEWHNCRGQDLSTRGSTYLTVDRMGCPLSRSARYLRTVFRERPSRLLILSEPSPRSCKS